MKMEESTRTVKPSQSLKELRNASLSLFCELGLFAKVVRR